MHFRGNNRKDIKKLSEEAYGDKHRYKGLSQKNIEYALQHNEGKIKVPTKEVLQDLQREEARTRVQLDTLIKEIPNIPQALDTRIGLLARRDMLKKLPQSSK